MLDPTVRPIIVQTVEAQPAPELGIGQIILQAVGLTGIILISSVLLGLALGGGIIWLRRRQARGRLEGEAGDQIKLRLEATRPGSASSSEFSPAIPGAERH